MTKAVKASDSLRPSLNVRVVSRDLKGRVLEVREQHNVFTNMGRLWLRNLLATATYTPSVTYHENNRPRYVALGGAGAFNGGGFRESTEIRCVEDPIEVLAGVWYKELYPQPSLADTDYFPTDYIIRYRTVIEPTDVSYLGNVDVSELALFTAGYNPLLEPGPATLPAGATGMIAYTIFSKVTKTPDNIIEVAWELRE